jgi:hypothetical protein
LQSKQGKKTKIQKQFYKLNNVKIGQIIKKNIIKTLRKKRQYGVIQKNKRFYFTIEPKDSFQKIIIVLQQETDKLGYNTKLNNSVLYMLLKEIVFNI